MNALIFCTGESRLTASGVSSNQWTKEKETLAKLIFILWRVRVRWQASSASNTRVENGKDVLVGKSMTWKFE
jgi:hypothetical protein